MRKVIPFDCFEQGQTIYFDIIRIAELESLLGASILKIIGQDTSITFCLAGLTVGLKHFYPQATRQTIAEKMDEFFAKGGKIIDLATPIADAILGSGIFGHPDDKRKNAETAKPSNPSKNG